MAARVSAGTPGSPRKVVTPMPMMPCSSSSEPGAQSDGLHRSPDRHEPLELRAVVLCDRAVRFRFILDDLSVDDGMPAARTAHTDELACQRVGLGAQPAP